MKISLHEYQWRRSGNFMCPLKVIAYRSESFCSSPPTCFVLHFGIIRRFSHARSHGSWAPRCLGASYVTSQILLAAAVADAAVAAAAWSWNSDRWHTLLPALSGHTVSLALFFNNVAWVSLPFLFYCALWQTFFLLPRSWLAGCHIMPVSQAKKKEREEKRNCNQIRHACLGVIRDSKCVAKGGKAGKRSWGRAELSCSHTDDDALLPQPNKFTNARAR